MSVQSENEGDDIDVQSIISSDESIHRHLQCIATREKPESRNVQSGLNEKYQQNIEVKRKLQRLLSQTMVDVKDGAATESGDSNYFEMIPAYKKQVDLLSNLQPVEEVRKVRREDK